MIVCPSCEHHNAEGSQTCAACGASLEGFVYRVCPACGALSPAQNTYCHRCLAELVPQGGKQPEFTEQEVKPFEPAESLPPELIEADTRAERACRARQNAPATESAPAPAPSQATTAPTLATTTPAPQPTVKAEPPAPLPAQPTAPPSTPPPAPEPEPPTPAMPTAEAQVVEPAAAAPVAPPDIVAPLPEAIVGEIAHAEDLLPLEASVSLPHRAQAASYAKPGETEQYDAELFKKIATEPASLAEAAHVVLPRQGRVLPGVGRALLYLLVLLAALTPLITGGQTFSTALSIQPGAKVSALAQTFDALPENAHVLVSIDYEPAYAGELDQLALAVLRHLASRNVNLVVMSTKPAGMGLAQRLLSTLVEQEPAYQTYGEHYVLAGYLAGQEVGLRTLTSGLANAFVQDYQQQQPLSQLAATRDIATLSEFDGIVVLSDDSEAVRRWIEQVNSRTQLPIYALVSARIKPLLMPYARSGQLSALLGGVGEAAEYGVATLGSEWLTTYSDAYVAFLGVLLLVAVVTNIAYLVQKRAKRS